jgi:thiol-disulfide isomerase/thioredoxin
MRKRSSCRASGVLIATGVAAGMAFLSLGIAPAVHAQSWTVSTASGASQSVATDSSKKETVKAAMSKATDPTADTIAAYSKLAGIAMGGDDYPGIFKHNRAILALARSASPATQTASARAIARAYGALAYAYGNKMHPDSALHLLQQAPVEIPALADQLKAALATDVARYSLVGTKAPTLAASDWVNASGTYPVAGKVTMIEFTAHWCGPCRNSYPTMEKWHTELGPKGLAVVFGAQIEGRFDGQTLEPKAEVAANQKYFVTEHNIPWSVAFQPMASQSDDAPADPSLNWSVYHVGGIPEIVIVDRDGIIRQIVVGWDVESDATMTPVLQQLLSAGTTQARATQAGTAQGARGR